MYYFSIRHPCLWNLVCIVASRQFGQCSLLTMIGFAMKEKKRMCSIVYMMVKRSMVFRGCVKMYVYDKREFDDACAGLCCCIGMIFMQ